MGTLSPGRADSRPHLARFGVLLFACSLSLITYLDRVCIMRVKPSIVEDLQFDPLRVFGLEFNTDDQMGWVFAAFSVGYLLFEIPGGWMGDRWGARRVVLRIVLWWSAFTALTGLIFAVPGRPIAALTLMILVRFLFGAGEAGAYPNLTRVVRVWFSPPARASAQGLIWMSARFGGFIAPLVIGRLTWFFGGWRPAFWVLGAVGVAWAVLFYQFYRDNPAVPVQPLPETDEAYPQADASPQAAFDSGHEWPSLRVLAASLTMWAVCVMSFSVGLGWYFYPTWQPQYLHEVYGMAYDDPVIEILTGLPFLFGAVGSLLGGLSSHLLVRVTGSRRWGRSLIGVFGFGMAGLCVVATGLTFAMWQAVLLLCLAFFFNDLAIPVIWSVCADVGGRFVGSVAGLMNMANGTGAVLCVASIPLMLHYLGSSPGSGASGRWLVVYASLGCAWFVGAAAWLLVDAGKPIFGEHSNDDTGGR